MLDGDHAGKKAAGNLLTILEPFTQVHQISLPFGLDPDDLSDTELIAVISPFFS